jgi:hypothetical protein
MKAASARITGTMARGIKMGEVIDFPDSISYSESNGKITLVTWKSRNSPESLSLGLDGAVYPSGEYMEIPVKDLEHLCIAWLALHNPSVLVFDSE